MGLDDQALNDPHIKPAAGEFDKGVTVSFNSAASREDIWYDIYANTHYCINPVNSPRWPEHNLHVYEVRMYAPYLRKNIKDRAYRSVH